MSDRSGCRRLSRRLKVEGSGSSTGPGSLGFTLLELLIVLALLATILAMVWPRMQRRIARSQLKQLAIEFKEEVAEVRARAIREGQSYQFQFQPESGVYTIGPANQPPGDGRLTPAANARNRPGGSAPVEQIIIGRKATADDNLDEPTWTVRRELDSAVFLAHAESLRKLTAPDNAKAETPSSSGELETIQIGRQPNADTVISIESVRFTPDGRAEDLEFAFCDRRLGLGIRVTVRGLTGQVEIGDYIVFPRQRVAESPASEKVSNDEAGNGLGAELNEELPATEGGAS